jgi:hypothetical protein
MGAKGMSEYRLYCLNEAGNFGKVHEFEVASDAEAMKEARELKLPIACELWEHSRMVAKLEPHKAS